MSRYSLELPGCLGNGALAFAMQLSKNNRKGDLGWKLHLQMENLYVARMNPIDEVCSITKFEEAGFKQGPEHFAHCLVSFSYYDHSQRYHEIHPQAQPDRRNCASVS